MAEQEVTIRISAKNLTNAEFKKARGEVLGLGGDTEKTGAKTQTLAARMKSFFSAHAAIFKAAAAGVLAVVGALGAAAVAIVKLGQQGAVVADVRREFGSLSATMGESAAIMLGALRRGVVGTIKDFELMRLVNKAMGAGLQVSAAEMETLAAGARLLAKRTGGDTAAAFNTLTTAIANGTTTSLRALGVFVDQKAALNAYAASLGVTRGELTDTDRAAAFNVATLNELRGVIAAAGPQAADFGEIIAGWGVWLANAKDRFAELISNSPVLMAGLQKVSDVLRRAFGGEQEALLTSIVQGIERLTIMVLRFGQTGLSVAAGIHLAFSGIKVAVFGLATALSEFIGALAESLAITLDLASKVPGVGRAFGSAATFARGYAIEQAKTNAAMATATLEAFEAAKGQGVFAGKLQASKGALSALLAAMVDAGVTTGTLSGDTAEGTRSVNAYIGDERSGQRGAAVAVRERVEAELLLAGILEQNQETILGTGEALARMGREWVGLQAVTEAIPGVWGNANQAIQTVRISMDDVRGSAANMTARFRAFQTRINDVVGAFQLFGLRSDSVLGKFVTGLQKVANMAGALRTIVGILLTIHALGGGGFLRGFSAFLGFAPGVPPTVQGAQAGGLFSRPAFRVVAEHEPEVVGSPNMIVQAFTAALRGAGGLAAAGGGGGAGLTVNLNITAFDPNGLRKTVEDEIIPMLSDATRQNRLQARTKLRNGLGI